ncbi:hypothetical protein PI124_g7644 [Phytophthora idaei]|nr:hypothetical protein PI125_g14645 [Phytophthora idaei]KAG3154193.1 hypothetical protein PI126_g9748 [Phytophthora idaei]KAG3247653.1 hypothetical protein PI124_g7644 [Phytophthora idaei]
MHAITQLTVHLEEEQMVTFRENDEAERVLDRGNPIMLTAFFAVCASEAPENEVVKTITYQNAPKYFRWNGKLKKWVCRK